MQPLVECYSGHTYAQRPVALHWEGERLEVAEVQSAWRVPQGMRFRVLTRDDRTFELYYNETKDEWRVLRL